MIYITLGVVVSLLLYIWLGSPLGTSDRVGITTAISTVALAIYTSIYAWHTRKMANEMREQAQATREQLKVIQEQAEATKKQAEASMKMAEEMKLQRLAARPFVIPDIDIYFSHSSHIEKMKELAESEFPIILTNVGTAAAIELELSLKAPDDDNYAYTRLPLLLPGAEWKSTLTYVWDYDDEKHPIFNMPPHEGFYELKVTFKSAVSQTTTQLSEVTLPFDLQWSKQGYWWNIKRHNLKQNILEINQSD